MNASFQTLSNSPVVPFDAAGPSWDVRQRKSPDDGHMRRDSSKEPRSYNWEHNVCCSVGLRPVGTCPNLRLQVETLVNQHDP
jgi:hypothetical protein